MESLGHPGGNVTGFVRIPKGGSPRDLPIQAPRRYELVVNPKTTSAIDLDVPPLLLVRAERVIE